MPTAVCQSIHACVESVPGNDHWRDAGDDCSSVVRVCGWLPCDRSLEASGYSPLCVGAWLPHGTYKVDRKHMIALSRLRRDRCIKLVPWLLAEQLSRLSWPHVRPMPSISTLFWLSALAAVRGAPRASGSATTATTPPPPASSERRSFPTHLSQRPASRPAAIIPIIMINMHHPAAKYWLHRIDSRPVHLRPRRPPSDSTVFR
jgi:hypothetical protein